MEEFQKHLNKVDDELIELLSLRQEFKINCKNFKVLELGGHNLEDCFTSKLDNMIFNYELKNHSKMCTLFNMNLKEEELYEDLNLSRVIKYSYFNFLYDFCIFGDEEDNSDLVCKLDMEILFKIVERVHFAYNVIKLKYINNMEFYNKLVRSNDSSFVLYYLSNYIYQPTYLDIIKDKCTKYKLCDVLVCTFYKNVILPYYNEIQLHFCNHIKKKIKDKS
jgi:chorismate mutase